MTIAGAPRPGIANQVDRDSPEGRALLASIRRNGMKRTQLKPSTKPMRRSPMRRKPGPEHAPESFYLTSVDGKRWLWPQHWMSEHDFEETLLDWAFKLGHCLKTYHVEAPQRGERGFWDRVWCFEGRGYLTEQKVRDKHGVANTPTTEQLDYHYAGLAAGFDSRQWLWPDDAEDAWVTLTGLPWEKCPYASEVLA